MITQRINMNDPRWKNKYKTELPEIPGYLYETFITP